PSDLVLRGPRPSDRADVSARECAPATTAHSRSSDLRLIVSLDQLGARATALCWRMQSASAMSPIGHLMPRQCVPELSLPLAGGGSWRLSDQKPKHFTMLAFYRGMHCSVCRDYLGHLQSMHAAFSSRGVSPI